MELLLRCPIAATMTMLIVIVCCSVMTQSFAEYTLISSMAMIAAVLSIYKHRPALHIFGLAADNTSYDVVASIFYIVNKPIGIEPWLFQAFSNVY